MKKKETKIATNLSSGAEKVETVEKELEQKRGNGDEKKVEKTVKTTTAKGDAALGDSTKKTTKKTSTAAEKEEKAAEKRVKTALAKKKEKAEQKEWREKKKAEFTEQRKKFLAEQEAEIQKIMAEHKARVEKRVAEKKALIEKKAAEKEAKMREHAHAKANKTQERYRRKQNVEKNNNRRERKKNGYGGWIAAVVTLGVTTLALATTVTVGAIEMNSMQKGMMASHKGTMYELTGIVEHIDDDLDRVRISNSPLQQDRILTDLLVQARLAEADVEKLPISMEKDRNITEFVNRTAAECERMLAKLRRGEELSAEDMQTLEQLYKTNHSIRGELDKLLESMTDKDLMGYIKKGEGVLSETIGRLENMTLEENRAALETKMEKMKGAGMERVLPEAEKKGETVIDTARAEELCREYFSDYSIDEYQCVGETSNRSYAAYNVQGYDQNGAMLFAEIDRQSGELIGFDYYEECSTENFDIENGKRIAEEFLNKLGYEDLTAVRFSQNGSTVDFTFVYEKDGVAYYPDAVRVKVCRSRGVVSGMNASRYLKNHKERQGVSAAINLETAQNKLSDKLTVEASRLAVVKTARGERAAYEFLCSYEEEKYFIYLDAATGEEISIVNVQNIRW